MSSFLAEMAAASEQRVRAAKALISEAALAERARQTPPPPALQLSAAGFDLIAELKLRSPAAGALGGPDSAIDRRVTAYARAGTGSPRFEHLIGIDEKVLAHRGHTERRERARGVGEVRE